MNENTNIDQEEKQIEEVMSKIKHKIMVMSNKGGVGKSTVSANLASSLALNGYKVGVLDIDIHGPSQAKIFGLTGQRMVSQNDKLVPLIVNENLSVVTIASLIEDESSPLIWRGPRKSGILKQFLSSVEWGNLDFLIIDAPPGTGDEPLTIAQLLPKLDGVVIVTTPQNLAILDSKKAISFTRNLEVPLIGLIENMSSLKCPHCNEHIDLFSVGGGQNLAKEMDVDVLGVIPFDPDLIEAIETGYNFIYKHQDTEVGKKFIEISLSIKAKVEAKK